jgi:RNA polymerase sigma factor (sigma-70 family)
MESTPPRAPSAPIPGDDAERLFLTLGPRLQRILDRDLAVPVEMAEDACQVAWSRLLGQRHLAPERTLAWLATTAVREALRTRRREALQDSLDAPSADGDPIGWALPQPGPKIHDVVEHRDLLRSIGTLPHRQRRMLWLQAAGFTYEEISGEVGCTPRTVERQLGRARQRLRGRAAMA